MSSVPCEYCGESEAICRAMGCAVGRAQAIAPGSEQRKVTARELLRIMRNPLMLMSIPDRQRAYDIARIYGTTVTELLDAATHSARNT